MKNINACKLLKFLILILICISLSGCSDNKAQVSFNPSKDKYIRASNHIDVTDNMDEDLANPYDMLSVPTYITKIKDNYFIVDCYHNEVIYNDNLTDPISDWLVMTNDINMGHTIASDGVVYLIDDTESHRILVMEEAKDGDQMRFILTQSFDEIGVRPHYIIYNEDTDTFYAWSSMTGTMYLFRRDHKDNTVYLTDTLSIPELDGYYVRSFTIMDDKIYFVSGNANIIEAKLSDFSITNHYIVPVELCGMVQLTKIQDYYYITISTDGYGSQDAATLIRTKDLNSLADSKYECVYDNFIGGGTPYVINQIEDYYYLCEHRLPGHNIWQFKVENNEIKEAITLY